MRTRLTMALLIGLLTLAGCGGDPSATPSPDASTTASATPSPTAEPAPEMPAAATKRTKAGAIAFVRHYITLSNRAVTTGEVAALRRLSTPECASCSNLMNETTALYAAGGSIRGGDLIPRTLSVPDQGFHPAEATVDVVGDVAPQLIVRRAGAPAERVKKAKVFFTYLLQRDDETWKVSGFSSAS